MVRNWLVLSVCAILFLGVSGCGPSKEAVPVKDADQKSTEVIEKAPDSQAKGPGGMKGGVPGFDPNNKK